jgi:hypothetical protein
VNWLALVVVPPGVLTVIMPLAPAPTVAVIWLASVTIVNPVAAVPPNITVAGLVKFVPCMVTVLPWPVACGPNWVIVGCASMVGPLNVAWPPGVFTRVVPGPGIVLVDNTAVIVLSLLTVNDCAATLPKLTTLALLKPVPEIVTVAPNESLVGETPDMAGAGIKVNPPTESFSIPWLTTTLPLVPAPTLAVSVVALTKVTAWAAVPPKLTAVEAVKLAPVMVTSVS